MKPASPEMLDLIGTRGYYIVDAYTFFNGNLGDNVLRFCSGDQSISWNGNLYTAGGSTGPYFHRDQNNIRIQWSLGVEVDQMQLEIIPGTYEVFGAPLLTNFQYGIFDGCDVDVSRIFMPLGDYGDTRRGAVPFFQGRMAEIDMGRSIAIMLINSHMDLLDIQMPRNLYSPGCINTLGDASCTVNLADFYISGTVMSGSTNASFVVDIDQNGFITGTFDLGKIIMTSGVLNGLFQTVRVCAFGSGFSIVQFAGFFPSAPDIGDTFDLYFGCNKIASDPNGCLKFSNNANYRGFPTVPVPVTAV